MRKSKRFINGDIINWYDETSKCWRLGLFWKEDAYSYSNDRVIIYFPETLKNDYITLSLDTTIVPSTDTTLIQKYIEDLISDEKISFPNGQVTKRISEETGEEVYNISGYIFPWAIEKLEEPKWIDELIWCPSQCYCKFLDNKENKIYCIYLRWRHSDPWTSELIPCLPDGSLTYGDWKYLKTKRDYCENEYEKLKKECLKVIKKGFKNITWLDHGIDDF